MTLAPRGAVVSFMPCNIFGFGSHWGMVLPDPDVSILGLLTATDPKEQDCVYVCVCVCVRGGGGLVCTSIEKNHSSMAEVMHIPQEMHIS